MAKASSVDFLFTIDSADAGSLTDITQYITKFGDFVVNKASIDGTPFGTAVETWLQGVIKRHDPIVFSGYFDNTASTGPAAILDIDKVTHAVTRTFLLTVVAGTTHGGECWIEGYKETENVGDYVGYEATIRMTGVIT